MPLLIISILVQLGLIVHVLKTGRNVIWVFILLFAPVIGHLREVGEARSCSEIEDHFKRNFDVEGVTTACEYLADQGLIGKASTPVRLTKKSNIEAQELAFFYLEEASDGQ